LFYLKFRLVLIVSFVVFLTGSFSYSMEAVKSWVRADDSNILIAGEPIFVKAVIDQSKNPYNYSSFDDLNKYARRVFKSGFNALMVYQPLESATIWGLSSSGLQILCPPVFWPEDPEELLTGSLNILKEDAVYSGMDNANAKNILAWTFGNPAWAESADAETDWKGIIIKCAEIAVSLKQADKGHLTAMVLPVSALSVFNELNTNLPFDIVIISSVLGNRSPKEPDTSFNKDVAISQLKMALKSRYRIQKPVIIGTLGFPDRNRSTVSNKYGVTTLHSSSQSEIVSTQIKMCGNHFAGFALYQWMDIAPMAPRGMQNPRYFGSDWGLVDITGRAKVGLKNVSALLNSIPGRSRGIYFNESDYAPSMNSSEESMLPKIMFENFERDYMRGSWTAKDKKSRSEISLSKEGALNGEGCAVIDFSCSKNGEVGWLVESSLAPIRKSFIRVLLREEMVVFIKAPENCFFSLMIEEAGSTTEPVNGADGESWISGILKGTGEYYGYRINLKNYRGGVSYRAEPDVKLGEMNDIDIKADTTTNVALQEVLSGRRIGGNDNLDLNAIHRIGGVIFAGEGKMYVDDIYFE
jgi:hypothetical protein